MKYIITGGLGFIGSHLYLKWKLENKKLLIIDNLYSGILENINNINDDFINADIRDKNIEQYFNDGDIVLHFAGISSLPECQSNPNLAFDINVNGTINILEICRRKNIKKLIFASTSAVYENNTQYPCKESDEVNPTLIYSITKYTCEKLCLSYVKNYDLNICIVRFFNVYGGNQDNRRKSPPLISYIIRELKNNNIPKLHSDGNQKRDYIYINDLLELLVRVTFQNTKGQIINACSNTLISVKEIFNIIKYQIKTPIVPQYENAERFWCKYDLIQKGNNPLKSEVIKHEVNKFILGDNIKARTILQWDIKFNMEQGIQDMIVNL